MPTGSGGRILPFPPWRASPPFIRVRPISTAEERSSLPASVQRRYHPILAGMTGAGSVRPGLGKGTADQGGVQPGQGNRITMGNRIIMGDRVGGNVMTWLHDRQGLVPARHICPTRLGARIALVVRARPAASRGKDAIARGERSRWPLPNDGIWAAWMGSHHACSCAAGWNGTVRGMIGQRGRYAD